VKVEINRRKNFLYSHEKRAYLIGVILRVEPKFCRKVPVFDKHSLKEVIVGLYKPTKKVYVDPKQFPGKQMPQYEYGIYRAV